MRILIVASGTNVPFCGPSSRDHTLARALRRLGHTVRIMPLYLPMRTSGAPETYAPLFFAANSTWIREKISLLRHMPHTLGRLLDLPAFLCFSPMNRPILGLAPSLLQGIHGPHAREFHRFASWLKREARPDAILLSNTLLTGFAPVIREAIKTRIFVTIQGEDTQIETLGTPASTEIRKQIASLASSVDGWIAVSHATRERFTQRTRISPDLIHTVWTGIDLDAFVPDMSPPDTPVLGFLGRLSATRGLDKVIHAFIELKRDLFYRNVQLRIIGTCPPDDRAFTTSAQKEITAAGFADDVSWHIHVNDDAKAFLLRGCTLVSVPPREPEAFGLFIPETLASGVPLVLPRSGSYPELITATGGGILYDDNTTEGLLTAWRGILSEPAPLHEAAQRARESALRLFRSETMARKIAALLYACEAH